MVVCAAVSADRIWMCNLYSLSKDQKTLRRFFNVGRDETGNIPPLPGILPHSMAPVVRQDGDERVMLMMRWGFPPPLNYSRPATPVINVRNLKTSYWRSWVKRGHRCLVPATAFCEWADGRPKVAHWFALDDSRPLFAFAGIWRLWVGEHRVFAFLTTEANTVVAPVHSKAMPVILTAPEQFDRWLCGDDDALSLQAPLPDGALQIVARREKEDP
jgi:putative SOS response-associated peptidase YedK